MIDGRAFSTFQLIPTGGLIKTPLVVKVPIVIGNIPHKEAFEKLSKGNQDSTEHVLPEDIRAKYEGMPEPKIGHDKQGCKRIDYT